MVYACFFFFQAGAGKRVFCLSGGLGVVYRRHSLFPPVGAGPGAAPPSCAGPSRGGPRGAGPGPGPADRE